ncbi:MAG: dihydrofolate reductase [Cyclobacteriaceae bacterium]
MIISMIAAMSSNRIIGVNNDLPWHLPDDFQFFKEKTKGHHVIMGRKNFESLPPKFKPLPQRTNLILSRNPSFAADGTISFVDLPSAIDYADVHGDDEAFIIGGGQIYELGLAVADRIYLTEIDAIIMGDTKFPIFDKDLFKEVDRSHHPADDRHDYPFDFVIYERI